MKIESLKKLFAIPASYPQLKKSITQRSVGLFFAILGTGISVYGQRLGINNRTVRLITGGITFSLGVILFGRGASTLSYYQAPDASSKISGKASASPTAKPSVPVSSDKFEDLPKEVRGAIEGLFAGSPYSLETLPDYPTLEASKNENTEREKMSASVMKGRISDGRHIIAIKVECSLTEKDINTLCDGKRQDIQKLMREELHANPEQKALILLHDNLPGKLYWDGLGELCWQEIDTGKDIKPSFFTWNFTCPKTGEVTKSQENAYPLMQTLFKTGASKDRNGILWKISQ